MTSKTARRQGGDAISGVTPFRKLRATAAELYIMWGEGGKVRNIRTLLADLTYSLSW